MNKFGLHLVLVILFLSLGRGVFASGLSSASAVLSNPRLSYEAGVSATIAAGNTVITISSSGNADNDTNHLFPDDPVTVGANSGLKINAVVDTTTFTVNTALGTGVTSASKVYAAQSGSLITSFYTGSAIPIGGSILIHVPAPLGSVSGSPNDGLPDTASLASNGFDFNTITSTNVTCPAGFTAGTPVAGTGGSLSPHVFICNWTSGSSALGSGAHLTVTMGDGTKGLINPAPATGHVQGQSDAYNVQIYTKSAVDGGGSEIESVQVKVAPDEGVLVSATVDETLSFSVAAVVSTDMNTTCFGGSGAPAGTLITSTATTIPFGSSVLSNTFYNAAQQLTVFTNAPGGYSVKVEENDQMGKDGNVCVGAAAGEASNCIKDSTCDAGACTEATSANWSTNTNNGLGYTLTNISPSTDASFAYNESARTFSAKQFPDQEAVESKQIIMSNTGVVNGKSGCIVYRLSVSGTQPAGYYFNKIKYTASASF